MECTCGWYDTGNPADMHDYEQIESRDSSLVSVMTRYGQISSLRRTGAPPIVEWAPTGSYRLTKNGVVIVNWTRRLNYILHRKQTEHDNDVRNSVAGH